MIPHPPKCFLDFLESSPGLSISHSPALCPLAQWLQAYRFKQARVGTSGWRTDWLTPMCYWPLPKWGREFVSWFAEQWEDNLSSIDTAGGLLEALKWDETILEKVKFLIGLRKESKR